MGAAGWLGEDPRSRYAEAVRRACESGELPLVRELFTAAAAEVFTLRGLLSREDEIRLGGRLAPQYQAGASLLALSQEIGRSTQYIAKVLRMAGVTIRPAYRPVQTSRPVNLVELRRRYEGGSSVASLAHRIRYSYESTRKFLLEAGAELRPSGARRPVRCCAPTPDADA